ncbi:hypothetical protein JX265_011515 [Neoarthrinium moseri]|uniref:Large ribosomal subunit protein bL27m n=1 Tax=Neoarthrinium moseri TaxID=1658444 RepID=A0A9Q0AJJ1_9PEZI|nr:hypothetical protein JX265_011515 [Neoarthrinium moseri]
MRLSQLHRPVVAAASTGAARPAAPRLLQDAFAALRIRGAAPANTTANVNVEGRRYASVKSQGMYRLRDSATIPKKMGAKKTGDSFVIPGNIIYKQRGTIWFPGENVGMGRDHTLFAKVQGYVKYYKDPLRHPDRQYIGVVFDKNDTLPTPPHAMRRRKLGMTATEVKAAPALPELSPSGIPNQVVREGFGRAPHPRDQRVYKLQQDGSYSYREENWRLGSLIRTEKRKMGSRRVAMRHRRRKSKAILLEMRRDREDKIARRKEALDEQRAARQKRIREYLARQKASKTADGSVGSPKQSPPTVQA